MHLTKTLFMLFLTEFVLQLDPSSTSRIEELATHFNITIETQGLKSPTKTLQGTITFREANTSDLKEYVPLLANELKLYPRTLIKKSQLRRIVLCEQLAFEGQVRNAVPDFENDTLYLEVRRGGYNKQYLRKVIHHDFYHMIDYRDDGQVYTDADWAKLNASDFKYGSGGQNAQADANTGVLTDKFPGFLNHYSTTGVEEDKAEVFANMLVQSDFVDKRQAADAILKSKVDRMKQMMQRFCVDANEDFWKAGREAKRQ